MKKYRICVYAICKNEEKFIHRWMDSVSEADHVVVLDTGSTDNSVKKLRERGAIVYEEIISPWRFDVARNKALAKVPTDVDICVSNDIDEVFEPGWREKLESSWNDSCTRARYMFVWSHNEDGSINKQFSMEKVHSRIGFQWINPVHEVLQYVGEKIKKDQSVFVAGMILHHFPDDNKSRNQYLPLLELSVKENPNDDRSTFWLGREYVYYKQYDNAIRTLKQHLNLPSAKWLEERSASMRFIARAYDEQGDTSQAKIWLLRSIAEYPMAREPYLALAKIAYKEKNWALVYVLAQKALNIKEKSGSYLVEIESWGEVLHDLAAISAYYLGLYDEAIRYAKEAVEINSSDERLKNNLIFIENAVKSLQGGETINEA